MTRILIVDDHVSIQEALSTAFDAQEDFAVVGTCSSAAYAPLYCEKLQPDLVFMDVCTEKGASGIEAVETLRRQFPKLKIIVMTAFEEVTYVPRARQAGADAFVYKSRSLSFFIETARGVVLGETFFPEPRAVPVPTGEAPLTDREMEILRLLCRHMTNREIASELFISENTVKYHKANMLAKTGFSTAVDLAFYMISNGWINPLY